MKHRDDITGKFIVWHSIGRTYLGECLDCHWNEERQATVVKARHFNGELWNWEPIISCVEVIE